MIAVHDHGVQAKAGRGGENPRARHSTKRRGGRGGSRSGRKCRELTHADPEIVAFTLPQRDKEKVLNRRVEYALRLMKKLVRLDEFYVRMKKVDWAGRLNLSKNSLRKGRRGLLVRIVRLVLSPGGSLLLAKARTLFLLKQLGSPVNRLMPSFTSWKRGSVGYPIPPEEVLFTYRDFTRSRARGRAVVLDSAVGQMLICRVRLEACTPNPTVDCLL